MKKKFNRREFLRSSIQGLGVLAIMGSPISILAKNNSEKTTSQLATSTDPLLMQQQAKEYFYKKEYANASEVYKQLISLYPDRIAYYDGYTRVLNAQQNLLGAAELYRAGLQKNSKSPYFKHRLGLTLRSICLGDKKAEMEFVEKYGHSNLMEFSATLIMEAIASKENKGFMMDLKDFETIGSKINNVRGNVLSARSAQPIIADVLSKKIKKITSKVEKKWTESRKPRKHAIINPDIEIDKIKNKNRRVLHFSNEKKCRTQSMQKAINERYRYALNKNIKSRNLKQVEKYGALILTDNIRDIDVIGKLRKCYRQTKSFDQLIKVNRHLHEKNNSFTNALALASTLVKYSNNSSDIKEAESLMNTIYPYVNTLSTVNITTYYLTMSKMYMKNNQLDKARTILLEGIDHFDGRGGLSYSLIENYAMTYWNNKPETGVLIMKTLQDKNRSTQEDLTDKNIQKYLTNYVKYTKERPISIPEQIKSLSALVKLQEKAGSSEASLTRSIINSLQSKISKKA